MITPQMIADAQINADLGRTDAPAHTPLDSLSIYSATCVTEPVAALFEPRFYVLLQGAKRMMIGGQDFVMRPGACALSTLGLPFQTQVLEASPDIPYLGAAFALDASVISEVLFSVPEADTNTGSAFAHGLASQELADLVARILALLRVPADIPVLAPLFERELTYRLAHGPLGGVLRAAAQNSTRFNQVRAAAEWIRGHADEPMNVSALATQFGMSVTSFHRHFRAVTGTSPLAYQRHIRLLAARARIMAASHSVTAAAFAGGYSSTSQFSREYKQMFGVAPVTDRP